MESNTLEKLVFSPEAKGDRYKIEGKPLTGVTTILHGALPKPALIQWSANQACEYVKKNLKDIDDLSEVLQDAKYAHRTVKEKAGDIGTKVHKAVENWINDGVEPDDLEPKAQKMFNNFRNWALENDVQFVQSEQSVYSEKHWYAGTYDFLCEINGKKYIGDLKTSSGIYPEHFIQMAAYRMAIEELGLYDDIEGSVVVRCGKKADFEVAYRFDYETDKKLWLAALEIYRGLKTFSK